MHVRKKNRCEWTQKATHFANRPGAMAAANQVHYFKQGQIWGAGFDGLYNTDDAVDCVTSKVGEKKKGRRAAESKTQQIVRQREREAFERVVVSRAEQFKRAFSKLDLDGDGKLSFEEFSHGLQSLGVLLPKGEVEAIWRQVPRPSPVPPRFCLAAQNTGCASHSQSLQVLS